MRQAAPTVSETSTAAKPRTNLGASDGPKLAHVTEQPGLPIKFDSKRGCDQIRARLYHDHRLIGLELAVALALSEFVTLASFAAYPKQKLIGRMVHATRARVSNALQRLETKGVLTIDRNRSHCRYVFLATWRGLFKTVPRCAGKAHLDVPGKHISNTKVSDLTPIQSRFSLGESVSEPYVLEPVRTIAAADVLPAAASRPDDGQQQQRRIDGRIEGLIGACAARARTLGRRYDEAEDRERLTAGEIDVDDLQRLADELQQEINERQYRRRR